MREGALRDVVDRIEDRHLAVVDLAFGLEQVDRPFDDIAQAGALALREVADRIVDILGRIAVAGKDRLVDPQRIGADVLVGNIGVGQEGIAENQRQLTVRNDRMPGARERPEGQQAADGMSQ